jgi:CDP-diacylglycerol---glycerol-3-phosphate 3-phosphatidyltransferase
MASIYQLKPAFQRLLLPLVKILAARGVTANAVTLLACGLSLLLAALLCLLAPNEPALFLLLPLWMFLRMALNAIDGMLARDFAQKSPLGAYLNELTDVISDAALYLPFALIAPFSLWSLGAVIWLAALSEMSGALGPTLGARRQYQGPMGKSDRALVFGALGLWVGLQLPMPGWLAALPWLVCGLMLINIRNRIRAGLAEIPPASPNNTPERP